MMTVKFKDWECQLEVGCYSNGRVALSLVENAEPVAVATVNMPNVDLEDGEVCIKDYSENEGMFAALVAAGVVERQPVRAIPSGFVNIPVAMLTEAGKAFVQGGR